MGPWDHDECLHHGGYSGSIADMAVSVLERADVPLPLHDISRLISRELRQTVAKQSLSSVVGADRRFCWAGKGIYGLFRHGLIPGPRSLAGVGGFILLAHGRPLHFDRLSFAMKWVGYRFQDQSLWVAMNSGRFVHHYEPQTTSYSGFTYRISVGDAGSMAEWLIAEGTSDSAANLEQLKGLWRTRTRRAMAERTRRLRALGGT